MVVDKLCSNKLDIFGFVWFLAYFQYYSKFTRMIHSEGILMLKSVHVCLVSNKYILCACYVKVLLEIFTYTSCDESFPFVDINSIISQFALRYSSLPC